MAKAGDAERRRVERELHDGPQQQLIGLAVNLQLARRLAETNPAELPPLLEEMRRDVQDALEDVRRLACRVYPPVLADRGLVEALHAAAAEAAVPTRVEAAPTLGRLSPEIETAVYFCCLEALEQVPASQRVTIRLGQEATAFDFVVTAEGVAPDAWPEQAMLAIGDRLGAVGGRLTPTAAPPRGACLAGTIPLGRRP